MANAARRLLALYPRAWRDRYGEEFLELLGDERLTFTQVVNIVSGAIDARVSPEVRASTAHQRALAPQGGSAVITTLKRMCAYDRAFRYTTRDGLIAAAVMIISTVVLAFGGAYLRRHGWPGAGEYLKGVSFPVALVLSSNVMWLKGQSRTAKLIITGLPLILILFAGWIAMLI